MARERRLERADKWVEAPGGRRYQRLWSASSIALTACLAKYNYAQRQGWRSRRESDHQRAGAAYHAGAEVYDRALAAGVAKDDALVAGLRAIHEQCGDEVPTKDGHVAWVPWESDISQKGFEALCRALVWTTDELAPLAPLRASDGSLFLEQAFEVPLPRRVPGTDQPYALYGYLDKAAEQVHATLAVERKTTKTTLSGGYFARYNPDVQTETYDYAGDRLWSTAGVMIEATQLGATMSRAQRHIIYRTPAQRAEFETRLLSKLARVEEAVARDEWPMETAHCYAGGGRCQFADVCALTPEWREAYLKTHFVREEK